MVVNLVIKAVMSAVSDSAERREDINDEHDYDRERGSNVCISYIYATIFCIAGCDAEKVGKEEQKRGHGKRREDDRRDEMKGSVIWTLFIRRDPPTSTLEPLPKRPSIKRRGSSVA